MPRKSTKSIAVLQIVLYSVLAAADGLLVTLLGIHPDLLGWLKNHSWVSLPTLLLAFIVINVATIAMALWQHFSSRDADELASRPTIDEMFLERYERAIKEGLIAKLDAQKLKAEMVRQAEELLKLQEQVAARSSEPPEAQLSKLLEARDLDGALRLKSQQVQSRRGESAKLPRDLYELGTIHALRFEWPQALAAYREAWELGKAPEHGFKYAVFAQKLNHFNEAIAAYEALLHIYTDPPDRAKTLNNLAVLYHDTQRINEAVQAYGEALDLRRKLAEANHDAYLPDVAMTLNNLAILYRATQRMKEAGQAYGEALATYRKLAEANPGAYLPDVAMTLNNLANLYSDTQRMKEAGQAYGEALAIRRKLAEANPDAYLPYVAHVLNNLAILYSATQRMKEAGQAYGEALATYRKLSQANPDAYLPYVATTLNNLGLLYSDTQRMKEAEQAYGEALVTYRELAEANPDAYLPDVATTLNNLANLYSDTQRMKEAGQAYGEALAIRRKLAEANPDTYLPYVATTLNNLANLDHLTGRTQEAETHASEAERILEPLWQANPELHGNLMAKILWTRVLVSEASKKPAAEACALARRALAAAYDPALKQSIQQLIDRLCPASQG
jgi:tetratricopeptide (TPR) repeat protein